MGRTVEVDEIVIDAKKATRIGAWIFAMMLTFVGSVAGGSWAVATWKVGIETHLQHSDEHMEQIDQKLDQIIRAVGRENERGIVRP